ncbi:cytochrome o ubiquinol oxidase subunit IV [Pararhizobium mangrovi]|uniref:Cytochrome bo(3) ubiquinol oxidase subunit 4 n=2 Tax=Pararhizobium mangrovi TaxID=2590452 RepID=A0A506U8J9_9HYPH|nr:cytochrome o ubiquinol oxidase subunit IV [Pararhizobium mangrovi]
MFARRRTGTRSLAGSTGSHGRPEDEQAEYRRELGSYVRGVSLAFVLTAIPFALVHWSMLSHGWLLVAIGVLALVQVVVHFRFFLHIDPPNQHTDDLMLILFTSLILIAMAGGTTWILTDLAARMH